MKKVKGYRPPNTSHQPLPLRSPLHDYEATVLQHVVYVTRVLLSIRDTGGDWIDGVYGDKDPVLKGEKDAKTGHQVKIPDRDVGPSSTQVAWYIKQCFCFQMQGEVWPGWLVNPHDLLRSLA